MYRQVYNIYNKSYNSYCMITLHLIINRSLDFDCVFCIDYCCHLKNMIN